MNSTSFEGSAAATAKNARAPMTLSLCGTTTGTNSARQSAGSAPPQFASVEWCVAQMGQVNEKKISARRASSGCIGTSL